MQLTRVAAVGALLLAVGCGRSDTKPEAQPETAQPTTLPKRGVKGMKAPAWNVAHWSNLPPDKASLEVSDFDDKVVFMLFFQSW